MQDGDFHITIKHRNCIETTSAFAISFAGFAITNDFSSAASQAFGDNLKNLSGNM
ncbi:MAG: hypothetical protein AB9834_12780 [Lentimicrobium sp.]